MDDQRPLRIGLLDDYQRIAPTVDWSPVPRPVEVRSISEHVGEVERLAESLAGCQVVVAMRERTPIDAALLDRLPELELLVTTGPSNAAIDVAAANERGVVVSGTGGYLTPTSELTWGLILALLRHIPAEDRNVRAGGWQHTIGVELAGRTLGLVGVGRLGTLVARVGTAFGMRVIGWSQNLTPERAAESGVERVDRDELFATSDVVSIHLVLSERTRGLVGRRELDAMKPTAVLVNTSRGPIVDEPALVEALAEGRIAGAALDVFDV
ncbi:MAG TPA: D-2-hydroxyacid dehydrogenase family protein, partial [Acidimicrobiales bacterium]|nr:D-2-hydroxyacid dehydrogenase family protein [Acidimicrobiales bacterium]